MIKPERDWDDFCNRQQIKTWRLLRTLEEIASHRFPVSFKEIHRAMSEVFDTSDRTTRRDVALLQKMELIRVIPSVLREDAYQINHRNPLLAAIARTAAATRQPTTTQPGPCLTCPLAHQLSEMEIKNYGQYS